MQYRYNVYMLITRVSCHSSILYGLPKILAPSRHGCHCLEGPVNTTGASNMYANVHLLVAQPSSTEGGPRY